MKSEHIEQALRILSERRIAAQADYQARFQTIQTAIPEIGEINQQLSQASLSIMQIIQSGQQVQEKIAKLQAQNQAAQQWYTACSFSTVTRMITWNRIIPALNAKTPATAMEPIAAV